MARKNLLRELMADPIAEAAKVDGGQLAGVEAVGAGKAGARQSPRPGEVDGRQLSGAEVNPAGVDGRQLAEVDRPSARAPGFGAIGAVGRSIADLKARALVEIDPGLIDPGGLADRIGADAEEDARLMESIREHGQQVPVLARPHPGAPGRYQIVYGRRRARALAALGRPVKALVRELDDRDLVLAQGQENSARRDLSFIEKANFARQMLVAGYDRATAQAALSTDKTQLSRMLSVTEKVPEEVILAIGAAHGIGRDRWCLLAELYTGVAPDEEEARAAALAADGGAAGAGGAEAGTAEARFEALEAWLRVQAAPRPRPNPRRSAARAAEPAPPEILRAEDGTELAVLLRRPDRLALLLDAGDRGFGDWLTRNLAALHRNWRAAPES